MYRTCRYHLCYTGATPVEGELVKCRVEWLTGMEGQIGDARTAMERLRSKRPQGIRRVIAYLSQMVGDLCGPAALEGRRSVSALSA